MLNHFARLSAIATASQFSLNKMFAIEPFPKSAVKRVVDLIKLNRCVNLLIDSLATDSPHRDEALRLVFASPLNMGIACEIVEANQEEEDIETILYHIINACYAAEDAQADKADAYDSLMPTATEERMIRMKGQRVRVSKPKGSTLADKRRGLKVA